MSSFKLPGGYVDQKEDFDVAAMREVKEETGISTSPIGIVTIRHTHNLPLYGTLATSKRGTG